MSAKLPEYRRHCRGYAFVQHRSIPTKDHRLYLGKHGTKDSRKRYAAFLERLADGEDASPLAISDTPCITEVIAAYLKHAKQHYRREDGVGYEYELMKAALLPLRKLHGDMLAHKFGPRALCAVLKQMAKSGLARTTANHNLSRIKRMFRWASSEEIVPPELYQKLTCVPGLYKGQHNCREPEPVKPAPIDSITALVPYLSPTAGAMLRLQFYCGMRPSETCLMRACDIDTSGKIWLYRPHRHKTAWRGHQQVKAIPAIAQKIIKQHLRPDREAYIFSPVDARRWSLEQQAKNRKPRKTKRYPCEVRRLKELAHKRARRVTAKLPSDRYTAASYRQSLAHGFTKAAAAGVQIPTFTPNQVRHSILTFVSQRLGQQAAQRWAGHENLNTTNIYTERQTVELVRIANDLGPMFAAGVVGVERRDIRASVIG